MEDWMIPAGIAAAGVLGSVTSEQQASKDRKKADKRLEALMNEIRGVQGPELSPYALEQYTNEGSYTPEEAQAALQAQSEMAGYSADPRLVQAQMDALSQLTDISKGGMTAGDRAAIQEARMEVGTDERGRQEAIMQNMAARGMSGGGQEMAARLASSQGASNRLASDARNQAMASQQRALTALSQGSNLAGNMRSSSLNEADRRAQAVDAINRFNSQNTQQVGMANVAARNAAAQDALSRQQSTANQNVDMRNKMAGMSNDLAQQQYANQMTKVNAMAGTANNQANNQMQSAAAANQGRYRQTEGIMGVGEKAYAGYNRPKKNPQSQWEE
jgi:hypothetical protein